MTIYYIAMPEERTTECIRLEAMLDGLRHVFGVQRIAVIGIVTDDARLDPILRSLAKDVIEQEKPSEQPTESSVYVQKVAVQTVLASQGDWVAEEQPAETQAVETSPTEIKPAEGERACIMCGNPVPKGRRSPTCSKPCYMKHYWETHPEKVTKSTKPRKQRGVKAHKDDRTGDGIAHGRLNLGRG